MAETDRQIEDEEVQKYFNHKERLIEFPQMVRKYLGLKEINPNWEVMYQYHGYKDSYRKGISRNTIYFEKNTIKKVIHESRHGPINVHKMKYQEMLYHEIDAHIETIDKKWFFAKCFDNKKIPVKYVEIGRYGFYDFESDLLIYIDKLYGSSFMQTRNYQNLEESVQKYSEFGHVKSKKEVYHYMQGLIRK